MPEKTVSIMELCNAVESGDLSKVKKLVDLNPEIITVQHPELSRRNMPIRAIHLAAREGHDKIISFLLSQGDDPITEFFHNYKVQCALTLAKHGGHYNVVAAIDQHFQNLIKTNPEIVHQSVGDIRFYGEATNTLLHLAVYHNHLPLVLLLLDHGADVNKRNGQGTRPIHLALFDGMGGPGPMLRSPNLSMAGALLARGAKKDIWVASALGDAVRVNELLNKDEKLVNFDNGANRGPAAINRPLAIAAHEGHLKVVSILLDKGADPNAEIDISKRIRDASNKPEWGMPLILSLARKHFDVARLLLDRGAKVDPEARPSILGVAIREGADEELINRIIVKGGRPELMHYIKTKDYLMIREFLDRSPDLLEEIFFSGIRTCDPNIVEMSLALKPKLTDGLGVWPKDGKIGSVGLFNHIIRYAFAPKGRSQEAWDNCCRVMAMILEYGANPNDTTPSGETALHHLPNAQTAYMHPNEDVLAKLAQMLIDKGANVNAVSHESNMTPLGMAVKYNKAKLISLYLMMEADLNLPKQVPNNQPLAIATSTGYPDIVTLLQNHIEATS